MTNQDNADSQDLTQINKSDAVDENAKENQSTENDSNHRNIEPGVNVSKNETSVPTEIEKLSKEIKEKQEELEKLKEKDHAEQSHKSITEKAKDNAKTLLHSIKKFTTSCDYRISDDVILAKLGINKGDDEDYKINEDYKTARSDADTKERNAIRKDFMAHLGIPKVVIIGFLLFVSAIYQIMFANKHDTTDAPTNTTNASPKTMFNYGSVGNARARAFGTALVTGGCGAISLGVLYLLRRAEIGLPLVLNMCLVFFILFLFDMAQEASGLNRYLDLDDTKAGNSIYYNLAVENGEPVNIINEEITNEGHGDPFLKSMLYLMAGIMVIIFIVISIKLFKLALCGAKLNQPGISVMCRIGMNDTTRKHTWLLFFIELIVICGINAIPIIVAPIIRKDTVKYTMTTWLMIGFIFILQLMFQFAGVTPNAHNPQVNCTENKNRDFTKDNIAFSIAFAGRV